MPFVFINSLWIYTMNRWMQAAVVVVAFASAQSFAQVNVIRTAPQGVKPAIIAVSATPPIITVDGKEDRLSPGARVRDRNNISTTHVTVVRQGDRILSVVRPESAHDRADWADEGELIGEKD